MNKKFEKKTFFFLKKKLFDKHGNLWKKKTLKKNKSNNTEPKARRNAEPLAKKKNTEPPAKKITASSAKNKQKKPCKN